MERDIFVNRLGNLVELQTLPGNMSENSKALDLVMSWVDKSASRNRLLNGNAEILLVGNGNILKPDIGYLVHADVVGAKDDNLFKMTERKGVLYGRGVSDMKYSVPLGVEILNNLIKSGSKVNMTLAITTDEEVGGSEGGKHLADKLKFRPKVLIVPDGGDGFVLINRSKGVAHVWIESKGKATHASTPWAGKSAISPLVRIAGKLLDTYEKNSTKLNWNTTMNLGFFQGGVSTNQVSDQAILKVDFRFPEKRSVKEIVEEVKLLSKEIDSSLSVKLAASGDAVFTDEKNLEVVRFLSIAKNVLGKKLKVQGEMGASDARHWSKYNVPVIMTKPVGGGIHSDNEWIDVKSCQQYFDILSEYISTFNR